MNPYVIEVFEKVRAALGHGVTLPISEWSERTSVKPMTALAWLQALIEDIDSFDSEWGTTFPKITYELENDSCLRVEGREKMTVRHETRCLTMTGIPVNFYDEECSLSFLLEDLRGNTLLKFRGTGRMFRDLTEYNTLEIELAENFCEKFDMFLLERLERRERKADDPNYISGGSDANKSYVFALKALFENSALKEEAPEAYKHLSRLASMNASSFSHF